MQGSGFRLLGALFCYSVITYRNWGIGGGGIYTPNPTPLGRSTFWVLATGWQGLCHKVLQVLGRAEHGAGREVGARPEGRRWVGG